MRKINLRDTEGHDREDFYEKLVPSVHELCKKNKEDSYCFLLCSFKQQMSRYLGHSPEQKYKNIHA